MLSTVSPETPMPPHVEDAYRVWLDAAGRNCYELTRILGGRRQTYQEWATKWRWKDRADLEDVESRDRAIRLAYHRLQNACAAFTDTLILAARCRVDANGVHYAIDEHGNRVDCPAPVAVRAASGGLERLGISPARQVTLDIRQSAPPPIAAAELDTLIARAIAAGDNTTLLALSRGELPPLPYTPIPGDFASGQPGGRVVPGPTAPRHNPSENGVVVDAEFTDLGDDGVGGEREG